MRSAASGPVIRFPETPIARVVEPVVRFLHVETASGVVLLIVTLAALILANSAWAEPFAAIWKTPLGVRLGAWEIEHSLQHWINDAFMVVFFFVVGLEIKRELVTGELRDLRAAGLPVAAALGGMIVPAAIYLALQWGNPAKRGWGIPMATDIAFVVGCLALLGPRAPHSLRVLLLTLAIVDDLGAILVIAVAYSGALNWAALAAGVGVIALILVMQRVGIRSVPMYAIVGAGMWLAVHESGVHATVAGVVLALLTPTTPWVSQDFFTTFINRLRAVAHGEVSVDGSERVELVRNVGRVARETTAPVERLETVMHPWVSFGIMPLFAFANAGVAIDMQAFSNPVAIAVAAGLLIGKPVGIVVASWLAVRLGWARLPNDVSWPVLAAGGVLAGIGFTMSLFVGGLALHEELLSAAKVGILTASTAAALLGIGMLRFLLTRPRRSEQR